MEVGELHPVGTTTNIADSFKDPAYIALYTTHVEPIVQFENLVTLLRKFPNHYSEKNEKHFPKLIFQKRKVLDHTNSAF